MCLKSNSSFISQLPVYDFILSVSRFFLFTIYFFKTLTLILLDWTVKEPLINGVFK